MARKTLQLLVAAFVMAALFSACGGGDDESADGSMSKAEFVAQGNAICSKATKKEFAAIERAARPKNKADEEAIVTAVILPPISQMADELRALGTPSNGGAEAKDVVDRLHRSIAEARADPRAILEGDDPFVQFKALSQRLGLTACVEI